MATPTNYVQKIKGTNNTEYDIWDANAVHDVDNAFSDTSTNPVQNQIVTKYKKTAIDIGALSLVDSSTYYNTTLSSQILTDINAMTAYEGFGLTFNGVINSSTVVFNVWQTAARTISNVNWIIFSGVYGEPDTGSSPQTKMCTVSVNMTAGALYIYPITVAVASHTHGNISFTGYIQSSAVTSVTSDYLLFSDASNSGKIERQEFINITSTLLNSLSEGSSPATANDYIICQYAGGGTTTTTYHRRKLSNVLGNVYWANVKVGTASSTSTSPTFNDMTSTTVKLRQSSSVTTVKAQMAYDSTEDAIKFTFV